MTSGTTDPDFPRGYARGYEDGEKHARAQPNAYPGKVKYWQKDNHGVERAYNRDGINWWEIPVIYDEVAEAMIAQRTPFASGYRIGYQRGFRIGAVP